MEARKVVGVSVATAAAAGLLGMLMMCSGGGEGRTPIQKAQDDERDRQRAAMVEEGRRAEAAAQAAREQAKQSPLPSRRGATVTGPLVGAGNGMGDHPGDGAAVSNGAAQQ